MRGNIAFLSLLADEGVTHLFGNPGTTELSMMAALPQCPAIDFVLGTQEAAVVAMADGYARASGRLAACNVHVAPGLGNAMGSLYNAMWVGSPLIVTAGQHEIGHGLTEPMLYAPLEPIARPLVKWAIEVTRIADLPRVIRRAAKIALAPPTGPVFLSLPGDVLDDDKDIVLGRSNRVDASNRPADTTIKALADRLLVSQQPVIICGHEVSSRRALAPAADLAELIGAAVYQDTIPTAAPFVSTHDCYLGALTRNQQDVSQRLKEYDLLICLGTDVLRMSTPSDTPPLPQGMPIVQISERSEDLAKNYPTEIAIQANVRETLAALNDAIRARCTPDQAEDASRRVEALRASNWSFQRDALVTSLEARTGRVIEPDVLSLRIVQLLPKDTILVDEGLTSSQAVTRLFAYQDAWSYYGLASGGIGFAVAGAIGIRLAVPNRPLVALIGDGSAMYNIQALWTAAHLRLPIVYVIANNGGYRILKQRIRKRYGLEHPVGMDLSAPPIDFAALATSMGVRSQRVTEPDEIAPALRTALAHEGPTLLDVIVNSPN
ncbi:MAG: thiamine pyrophosphate-dependent enzyme [Acidobacteriota bacterium]|nr:thiamine pyrophosphate-dependent enzyme [Acidobacteriota bacterium]